MALSAKLQVRQTQSLAITPQLMQAIRLLQMSGLELERFVADEMEQNPLLEQEREDADEPGNTAPEAERAREAPDPVAEIDAEPADVFPEQTGPDAHGSLTVGSGGTGADADAGIDLGLPASESLAEMLERSLAAEFPLPGERLIAAALLGGLDEAGYLTLSLTETAARLGASPATVEAVLRRCQACAPTGIFARSLGECLALQLAERNRLDPAMQSLLDNLELLAAGDRASLCLACGVDRDDLDEMIGEVRALDPKPGLAFLHEPVRVVVPDVFVRRAVSSGWTIELNDAALPRLIVNRVYHARIASRCCGDSERRYLTECLQKATWLEKSLDQRARTVLRVAMEIVRRQEGFLDDGVAFLKPLNLRMVADALGVHESTVSRAAANKTIATPRGVFEFRYFFTGAIAATTGGEGHSAEAVKHHIRRMIAEESPAAILSDDAIVDRLGRQGIDIARRTVAKYREVMRIGSSVDRRREKRLLAAS